MSPNRYENFEVHNTNSNTRIDVTDTDHNRETVNNYVAKNKFDQNYQNIVLRRKQTAVNQHTENQAIFNRLPVVSGKSSYKEATDRNKSHYRDISISSDSIPKSIR